MKIYLALEFYHNGVQFEDMYSCTELIGTYLTLEGAQRAIDRTIEDRFVEVYSVNIEDKSLPRIESISRNGTEDIIKYRAMIHRDSSFGSPTWQFYILSQEVRE